MLIMNHIQSLCDHSVWIILVVNQHCKSMVVVSLFLLTNFIFFFSAEKTMEMGGLTSSSNTFNGEPIVTINNSSPLLWTMTMGYEDGF